MTTPVIFFRSVILFIFSVILLAILGILSASYSPSSKSLLHDLHLFYVFNAWSSLDSKLSAKHVLWIWCEQFLSCTPCSLFNISWLQKLHHIWA